MTDAVAPALAGLSVLADPSVAFMLLLGTLVGLIFGVIPGLGSVSCIAILTPLTYGMTATEAVALMAGVMATTSTSGAVTSIVMNAPGTGPTAATVIDGYPLAQQGRAGFAIGAAALASGVGGILGLAVLFASIPVMREVALAMGPPELFLMGCLGLFALAASAREGQWATLMVAALGLMASLIGFDELSGEVRLTFGSLFLWDGLKLPAVMVGLFAGSEMIRLWIDDARVSDGKVRVGLDQVFQGVRAAIGHGWLMARSSIIGAAVGVTPGIGGTVASFLAYAAARATARRPERFGTGEIAGVIAPEASNNAKDGGALVPTLALGIPGSGEMAVFFSVLMLHGIAPGAGILVNHADVVWMLLAAMAIAGVAASVVTIIAAPWFARIAEVDGRVLAPVALTACFFGPFALSSDPNDIVVAAVFATVGYLFIRARLPRVPFAIAFALGPLLETTLVQSLQLGDGSVAIFWRSPAAVVLLCLLGLLAAAPYLMRRPAPATAQVEKESGVALWQRATPADAAVIALIVFVAGTVIIVAWDYGGRTGLFPSAAAWLALVALALHFANRAVEPAKANTRPTARRVVSILAVVSLNAPLTAAAGYGWAAFALTFLGLRLVSAASWRTSFALAAATAGTIWLVFDVGLGVRLVPI